jgi:hypothetical protein
MMPAAVGLMSGESEAAEFAAAGAAEGVELVGDGFGGAKGSTHAPAAARTAPGPVTTSA